MDAIDVLNDVRVVFSHIQGLDRPHPKTHPDYIETLRELSNVLSDASSHVRTLLNGVVTINTIPPELLAHIFTFYATETVRMESVATLDAYQCFNYPSPRTALHLTEVCKHWRDVSLSTPALWSGVVCGGAHATPTARFLHRSKSCPLHAIIRGDLETVEDLLAAHPSRVQHLLLVDSISWSRRYDPRRLLTNVAPDLLTCTLDLHSWPRGPSLPELGYSLFAGGASRLRALYLHSAKLIPLDSLPNLRVLALYSILGIPSLPHILALLGRCPALEEVCIHSNREPARIAPDARFEVVELRRVRQLALLVQNSVWLLAHLAVPASALIRVDDIHLQQLVDWPHLPSPVETQAPSTSAAAAVTRLRISSPKGSPIHSGIVTELQVELASHSPQANSGVCLNIAAPSSSARAVRGRALANVFTANAALFAHVTVLWAVCQSAALAPVLRALPSLRVLGVVLAEGGRTCAELASALSVSAEDGAACPALEALCVYNCQCKGSESESELRHLAELVASRAYAGHRVRRLALECDEAFRVAPHAVDGAGFQGHLAAIRARVDDLVLTPRGARSPNANGGAVQELLPVEWREQLGSLDGGRWPDWDFFAESRGRSRSGSASVW